ncbi:MAG: AAA family ATPase [Verrucomicrobiota bacterium]
MLDFHIKVVFITRQFESSQDQTDQFVSNILFWPGLSTFGNRLKIIRRDQVKLAEEILKNEDTGDIHERQIPSEPSRGGVLIELHPPQPSEAWNEPVALKFDTVHWEQEGTYIASIPDLEIEVVAESESDLPDMLEEHVRTAILRSGAAKSLFELAHLQRTQSTEIETQLVNLYPETPKERWDKSLAEDQKKSELSKVGIRMAPDEMTEAFLYEEQVDRLAKMLTGRRALSVLVVGPPGVGKSAVIHELVRRKNDHGLERFTFWKTSGARIVAGQSGFGDWQLRCQKIAEEAMEQNAILYFGNLAELLETGRAGGSSENIAGFFRPRMVRGELLAILECTPEQLTAIEKRDPRVLDGMRQLKIEEPDAALSYGVLKNVAGKLSAKKSEEIDDSSLKRVDALHRRYLGYSSYPGKPIRFLERLFFNAQTENPLTTQNVNATFSAETGLPLNLLEDSIPLNLDQASHRYQDRLMGQDRAVDFVVDTIAMIKARLARPGKPLGSFLFVGPTGVGKTELAKCLAEYFYGSQERMIRLDMSEFNSPGSATRLVSSNSGDLEGLLTAQMRDQPFSVVLLDEFEKAAPQVFDLFLQVLGEARLTDAAGRVADFSNAIVIMTSNLGAQNFRAGSNLGFGGTDAADLGAEEHFTSEAKKRFRPEFFNRIDRIVPFLPLTRQVLERIVAKELDSIQRRDGLRERQLDLQLNPAVLDEILKHGHDPRYGARPLRRELDQRLLRRVAEELNQGPVRERGHMLVDEDSVVFQRRSEKEAPGDVHADILSNAADLRRKFQSLQRATFVNELNSERYRLERIISHQQRKKKSTEPASDLTSTYARKSLIDDLLSQLERKTKAVTAREESLLLETVGQGPQGRKSRLSLEDYKALLIDLFAAAENNPDSILLIFQAERQDRLFEVVSDYQQVATGFGCEVELGYFLRKPPKALINEEDATTRAEIVPEEEMENFLIDPPGDVSAVALRITQAHAFLRFQGELGGHEFENDEGKDKKKDRLVISDRDTPLAEASIALESLQRPQLKNTPIHRHYNLVRNSWRDSNFDASGHGRYCPELLELILNERVLTLAMRAL